MSQFNKVSLETGSYISIPRNEIKISQLKPKTKLVQNTKNK